LVHLVVTSNWQALLLCGGILIVYNLANDMLLTYMPSYLSKNLDISEKAGLLMPETAGRPLKGSVALRTVPASAQGRPQPRITQG
jgi:hypothetical protein